MAELELRRRRADLSALPLLDFIPAASPKFESPSHLAPLAAELDAIDDGKQSRLVCHSPPRHGKTEMLLHWAVRSLMRNPELRIGYASYSSDLSKAKSEKALKIARRLGVDVVTDRAEEWRTSADGGMLARGVGGGWGGRGLDRLIIDDPIKDRAEAESAAYRKRVLDWFNDVAITRLEPNGSAINNMTRWHPKDLSGELVALGWPYLRIPAVCDSEDDPLGRKLGEVLWPSRWPMEKLVEKMRNEYTKASLYQGRPRPRGAALFRDAYYYDRLPEEGFRCALGLDLAYTAKSHADYSVAGAFQSFEDVVYITEVVRHQVEASRFAQVFKGFQTRNTGRARIYYGGGAEKAAIENIEAQAQTKINAVPAVVDKFVRAQPVSTAWNEGRVLLPKDAPWVADFVEEVCSFTGVNDDHDDQVDMLAAGFDEVDATMPFDYNAVQTRRYGNQRRGWV